LDQETLFKTSNITEMLDVPEWDWKIPKNPIKMEKGYVWWS